MAIEKTGILVDTSSSFTNPSRFEEAGAVRTISASNLTANTQYYVKGYVVKNGVTVYSTNTQSFYTDDSNIDYFTLSNATNTTNYIELNTYSSPDTITLEYTKDGTNWTSWTSTSGVLTVQLEEGEHVSFRGNNNGISSNSRNPSDSSYYRYFSASGDIRASGNIMTLIDKSGRSTTIPTVGCFRYLFSRLGSHLLSAPTLPATTLSGGCYRGLFSDCTNLTVPPTLPATSIPSAAYCDMFKNTGLTTAPALPATSLAEHCYYSMFYGSQITETPELPATTISTASYIYMFGNCRNLTTIRNIAATNCPASGMAGMFGNCTSLVNPPTLNVVGTVGAEGMMGMFRGCSSLTSTPILRASIIGQDAYTQMFMDCGNLRTISPIQATQIGISGMSSMFTRCRSITTAPDLPARTIGARAYAETFYNCTSLVSPPSILPAMILKDRCYNATFTGCTAMTSAPELPATDISNAPNCYKELFDGCSSLNEVKVYAQNWNTSNTSNWMRGTSASGSFYNLGRATIPSGVSGIPSGWTEYNSL